MELATAKTGIMLLTKKRMDTLCHWKVGDVTVQAKQTVKYLEVMLDNKLTFGMHIKKVAKKVATVTAALARTM